MFSLFPGLVDNKAELFLIVTSNFSVFQVYITVCKHGV